MKNLIYTIAFISLWWILVGASISVDLKIPTSKIEKSIKKLKLGDEINMKSVIGISADMSQSEIFKLQSGSDIVGYVYISRLNSCRAEGCSGNPTFNSDDFEYFDYFLITDNTGEVLNVKVYNYQATQGHQVMSRGWLKQFIGYKMNQELVYGQDIQAISGATISAKAITYDVERAEELIVGIINKE